MIWLHTDFDTLIFRKLPPSAVNQAPTFPLDTVLSSNSNGNSAENIDVPDNSNHQNNNNNKFRMTLKQKLSSCLLPLPTTGNSCNNHHATTGKLQDHAYDMLGKTNSTVY